jgi:protein TonB
MSTLLEGDTHLEQELTPEPIFAPATGSILLHGALFGGLLVYGILGGFFHHNFWGSKEAGGAIQVSLVSSALPLPADHPPNENVLSTETPSEAPAPPAPKTKEAVDDKAIAISGKQKPKQQEAAVRTPPHAPMPKQDNRAAYGEQAGSSTPRALQPQNAANGPVSVNDGDFGTRFGWYVDGIVRKMATSWNKGEVDPKTPKGTRVYLLFTVHRDGTPTDVTIDKASASATLNNSCRRGVQRVDSFGQLPASYNQSTLKVSYYCEY